jgi:hypothetical protein
LPNFTGSVFYQEPFAQTSRFRYYAANGVTAALWWSIGIYETENNINGKKPGGKNKDDDETTESVIEIDTEGNGIANTKEVIMLKAKGEVRSVTTRPIKGSSGDLTSPAGI